MLVEILVGLGVLIGGQVLIWEVVRHALLAAVRHVPRWQGWKRMHPVRASFQERLPRAYGFCAARLRTDRFSGLALSLMVLAATYAAFAIAGLVEDIRGSNGVLGFDSYFQDWFGPYRTPQRVAFAMWLTHFGENSALVAVIIVATGFLWSHKRGRLVSAMWITFAGVQIATVIGKWGLHRARPQFMTIATASSPSFPSGHTTGSAAVYGFVAYVIARDLHSLRRRFAIGYWAVIFVLLIGVSRVFLSVHHASDVLAGWLIGIFWLLVGFALAEHWRPSKPADAIDGPEP